MNQKELTETCMMISNFKKPFVNFNHHGLLSTYDEMSDDGLHQIVFTGDVYKNYLNWGGGGAGNASSGAFWIRLGAT